MVFRSDTDRRCFLSLLGELESRFGIVVLAFVLMGNHYHLIVRSQEGRLAQAMQFLDGRYAQRFNAIHKRGGAFFQGRYHSRQIDTEPSLQSAGIYLHLNPLRAGLVQAPLKYRWSSLPAYARGHSPLPWLRLDLLDGQTGAQYLDLISAEAEEVTSLELPLDDDGFTWWSDEPAAEAAFTASDERVATVLGSSIDEIYIPSVGQPNVPRMVGIAHAARQTGLPLADVAERYGLRSVSSLQSVIRRLRTLATHDEEVAQHIRKLGLSL